MVRHYKHVTFNRRHIILPDHLWTAAVAGGMSVKGAADTYKVPRSTLQRVINKEKTGKKGHPTVLLNTEEVLLATNFATMSDWRFPVSREDIKMTVKFYLDKRERKVACFKNTIPGDDWVRGFVKRNKDLLKFKMCSNLSVARANVSVEKVERYFANLADCLDGVNPANTVNYDETKFSDNPGKEKLLFRRSCKYPERVMNSTKSCVSLMCAGTASGRFLPCYVVYRAAKLDISWTSGGPQGTVYNCSKSGWFDFVTFRSWFVDIVIPYFRHLDGKKVIIGDNLASHLNNEVLDLCNTVI